MATEDSQDSVVDGAALMRPFAPSQIRQRPGPGKKAFSYVSGPDVIGRLLDATGNAFSWKVERADLIHQDTESGPVAYWVVVGTLALGGRGVRAGRDRRLQAGSG
jgi:hypothetical protein